MIIPEAAACAALFDAAGLVSMFVRSFSFLNSTSRSVIRSSSSCCMPRIMLGLRSSLRSSSFPLRTSGTCIVTVGGTTLVEEAG